MGYGVCDILGKWLMRRACPLCVLSGIGAGCPLGVLGSKEMWRSGGSSGGCGGVKLR